MKFNDTYFSRPQRYVLGIEQSSGRPYLGIPVSNRMVDYEESYWLTPDQYNRFHEQPDLAAAFAEECRRREHDDLLILKPGTDRGVPM
ncbi:MULTISPECIES: hypothetical protein [unclassified Mycolicibacterium]|uniref:hypothetical protein n=1 Tax=unclassified Mycolicibacterium TaxID=2636767 RepID=UPI0012DC6DEE|nr:MULTISPECIES: hypothetical protein [unclassified Mycolicibacterium]MUL81559.1 hypothetical protein [Mycolicibacterium sp. CBMA 329]MUL87325.1 hypothetical protein [Mycolicibacterium sp. CBMA 331]MUM02612.1 hypothetical protein [Mycolicibacterium sp. CBMA 334]MUM28923.1 hypothetical protein [Mycolicibacterium sp. CBMA 295]MUM37622.1 hypothetical protein [Mycolicibacterium sp. CBMA 247]